VSQVIGASQQAIDQYELQALAIFDQVRIAMHDLVAVAFSLTYEGPNAETEFNPGLTALAHQSVELIDTAMASFATAVTQVTSNISRSLGAGDITFVYAPGPLELPPPPGVTTDDFRIDVTGFGTYVSETLPSFQARVSQLFEENQAEFGRIPAATTGTAGWSGESRDYAQFTVVPTQTEDMKQTMMQVVGQIADFMTAAKDGTLSADQAGLGI